MNGGPAATVGAATLLAASEVAYRAVTVAGAAYMIGLGVRLTAQSFRHRDAAVAPDVPTSRSAWRGFLVRREPSPSGPGVRPAGEQPPAGRRPTS